MHLSLLAVSVVHTRGCGPGVAQLPWQLQALALSSPLAFNRKASQQFRGVSASGTEDSSLSVGHGNYRASCVSQFHLRFEYFAFSS